MNRVQAFWVSVLMGLVVLVFMVLIIVLFVPMERIFVIVTPTPTITLTPTITPTPTLGSFLPTAAATMTPNPTASNTPVPTVTPRASSTPSPTFVLKVPTPALRPTETPTLPPPPPPTAPPPPAQPTVNRMVPPRGYHIQFEAEETELEEDACTNLVWRVSGAVSVVLDGRSVQPSGSEEVCPDEDTTYRLVVELPSSTEIREETISVEE